LENRLPNDEHLARMNCPVYIFQGTSDWVVPYQSAIRLRPLLKPSDRFYTIEGGGHKNLSSFDSYQNWLDDILGERQIKMNPTGRQSVK
ncbi:MAG: alpha/beta hydrolase, partial [Bacteroidota bacterium]